MGALTASKHCYMQALQKYWQEFDAKAWKQLEQSTEGQMERFSEEAVTMKDRLGGLLASAGAGAAGEGAAGSGVDEDETGTAAQQPEHHLAGPHPLPPGAVPLSEGTQQSQSQLQQQQQQQQEGMRNDAAGKSAGSGAATAAAAENSLGPGLHKDSLERFAAVAGSERERESGSERGSEPMQEGGSQQGAAEAGLTQQQQQQQQRELTPEEKQQQARFAAVYRAAHSALQQHMQGDAPASDGAGAGGDVVVEQAR